MAVRTRGSATWGRGRPSGHADIDQDAHSNTYLDAHTNQDANQHAHANMDARGADSDTDKNANEDANAGRAYSDTHEDLDTDAREHSHAYTNGNAGWLDAGCVYNPLLGGKPGLHPRLAPNRGGLVR